MNNIAVTPKLKILSSSRTIFISTISLVFLWFAMSANLTLLVLLGLVTLFIIGIKKPIWALTALLVSQLTLASYMVSTPIGDVSLRLMLEVFTLLILWKAITRKQIMLGPVSRKLIIPVLLLIGLMVVSDLVNVGFSLAFKEIRNIFSGLLFVILLTAIINDLSQLKTFCGIVCLVIAASAIIGLFQHYNVLGMSQATIIPNILTAHEDSRVPGMSETALQLSYILPVVIIGILGVLLKGGTRRNNTKLLCIAMALMIAALFFTYTRSGLLALGFGLVAVILFLIKRIRWEIILILMFVLIGIITVMGMAEKSFLSGRSEYQQMESTKARSILQQAGVAIAQDNLVLGIGGGNQFVLISPSYADRVDPELIAWEENEYWSYRTLGADMPHNDFLFFWLSYGTVAVAVYLWLYFVIIRNCMTSYRTSKSRFIKGLSIGLAGALATYVANSFYHNLLVDLPLFWTIAAFSLVSTKLVAREKELQLSQVVK